MNKQDYVLGFIFSEDLTKVLLLRKNRAPKDAPQLLGKLNGIGGHFELSDKTCLDAMNHECAEETGLTVNWTYFAELRMKYGNMFCFYAVTEDLYDFQQKEDEQLRVYRLYSETTDFLDKYHWYQDYEYMANLDWIIPMALNHAQKLDSADGFIIEEQYNE